MQDTARKKVVVISNQKQKNVALYKVMVKFWPSNFAISTQRVGSSRRLKYVTLQSQMLFIFLLQWIQSSSSVCRVTVSVCGFIAGRQDNWMITQHISRMVNGTALQQVTVQVDFIMNTCDIDNNCRRSFAIHKYETSTINATGARNLSNYEFVDWIVPRDASGSVRENGSVNVNFATEATGFYLGIRDESSCIVIRRVLVFYYVCPAMTSDLIARPETIAPVVGDSTPIEVVGQCVENASPENGVGPRLTCSQNGLWSENSGAMCVCNPGFQSTSDDHSCAGMLSVYLLSFLSLRFITHLSCLLFSLTLPTICSL